MDNLSMSDLDLSPKFSVVLCGDLGGLELERLRCFGVGKAIFLC